jgi:hypothetical protein
MSCCGNKRQSLDFFPAINRVKSAEENPGEMSFYDRKTNGEAVFRYTGNTCLEVKSLFGERSYIFSKAKPLISVLAEDTAIMKAYAELREVN